jgi:hypothetical protein
MQIGDAVRVKHPTGGILAEHSFRVEELPEDPDGWVVIRGDIGGRHGVRTFRFHRSSLEVIGASPKVTGVHPATVRRQRIEVDLLEAIGAYAGATAMEVRSHVNKEYVERKRDEMVSALQRHREACYAELDDNHGLGKAGLDAAREVVEDAVWFPLKDKDEDAWLVSHEKMTALASAIGMEGEL